MKRNGRKHSPVHPGRILRQEFLEPASVSLYSLAEATDLSQMQISNIVNGKRGISASTALRLEKALGMSAKTWMNLQALYDLETVQLLEGKDIARTVKQVNLHGPKAA